MKKFILPILMIAAIAAGCMQTERASSFIAGTVTLNEKHTGWQVQDCAVCHATSTFLETTEASEEVHKILKSPSGDVYYDGCRSCHGGNGNLIDNTNLTNCVMCHSANVGFIYCNPKYAQTHMHSPAALSDCKSCHNVTAHPQRATTLYDMADSACLNCHQDHGYGTFCSSCHGQEGGVFSRNSDGKILRHSVSTP